MSLLLVFNAIRIKTIKHQKSFSWVDFVVCSSAFALHENPECYCSENKTWSFFLSMTTWNSWVSLWCKRITILKYQPEARYEKWPNYCTWVVISWRGLTERNEPWALLWSEKERQSSRLKLSYCLGTVLAF